MKKRSFTPPAGFPEDLLTPLPRRKRIGLLQMIQDDPIYSSEIQRRLELLLKFYGVKKGDDPGNLIWRLLLDWVPGFKEATPNHLGRPRRNYSDVVERRSRLLSAVDGIKAIEPELTEFKACERLSTRRGASDKEFQGNKVDTLRKELRFARRFRDREKQLLSELLAIGL